MKIADEFPVLYTNRLKLVEITQKNIEDYFRIFNDPQVTAFYTMPTLTEISQTHKYIEWLEIKYKQKKGISWGITLQGATEIIGVAGFNNYQLYHHGDVFGALNIDFWNRGIMTESLSEVIKYGFNELKLNKVYGEVMQGNLKMQNVFLKLNFRNEGIVRDRLFWNNQHYDMTLFSLLKSEFKG